MHKWYTTRKMFAGPFGNPMRSSEDAYELEALAKEVATLSCGYQRIFIPSEVLTKALDDNLPHTAVLTASTTAVDRDNEIILASGINTKMYRKNPVILWSHNTEEPPIGRSLWEKIEGNALKAKVKFADRPDSHPDQAVWFPDYIFALCEQGILRGVSIGALMLEHSPPTEREAKADPAMATAKQIIRKSLLLEISIVPVGCNQEALVENVSKGLLTSDYMDRFGVATPDDESLWTWDDCLPEVTAVVKAPSRLDVLAKIKSSLNR